MDVWLDDKNTPLEAFQYIILGSKLKNKNLIQVLGSHNFIDWTKYLDKYNVDNSGLATNEVEVLLNIYGERNVIKAAFEM